MGENEVPADVIKLTQETLGKFVKKPTLTEKLLKKPPFRFLFDIVKAVITDTGYFEGLYTAEELTFDNIKDRDDKIKFLQKLIDATKLITDKPIAVRPSKIVSGQEAEKTNELLQIIGILLEQQLDWRNAVQQITNGETQSLPNGTPTEKKSKQVGKEQEKVKTKEKDKEKSKDKVKDSQVKTKTSTNKDVKSKNKSPNDEKVDRAKKPDKDRTKEKTPSSTTGKSTKDKNASTKKEVKKSTPTETKEKEKPRSEKAKTSGSKQNTPSPIVSKEKEKEKVKDKEKEKPKEKPVKRNSLEEFEKEEQRLLEQANAADQLRKTSTKTSEGVHSKEASLQIDKATAEGTAMENRVTSAETTIKDARPKDLQEPEPEATLNTDTRMPSAQRKSSSSKRRSSANKQSKNEANANNMQSSSNLAGVQEEKLAEQIERPNNQPVQPTKTPAEPQQLETEQPELKPISMATNNREAVVAPQPAVKRENTFTRENSRDSTTTSRPRTSLRPPSARPASARPGAPRRRDKNIEIVLQPNDQVKLAGINVKLESFGDFDDDGENLVIIEDANADTLQGNISTMQKNEQDDLNDANKLEQQGHLVQQILETQKELVQQTAADAQNKSEKDQQDHTSSFNARQSSARQMTGLRDVIQTLTKSVNPLGKLMDYIPEDIDAMQLELTMWHDTYMQASSELKRERSLTESTTEPMKNQLTQIEFNIKEYADMIDASRMKIIQNSDKILKLLMEQ